MNAEVLPDRAYVAAFCGLEGLGPARLQALIDGQPAAAAWSALLDDSLQRERLEGAAITEGLIQSWRSEARGVDVRALWHRHQTHAVDVLMAGDSGWPIELLDDPDPPAILFGSGPLAEPSHPSVAIIGTRRCTSYGRSVAAELGSALAERGITVVSGLATGVDSAAQRAALEAGGDVIGVVGSGIDIVYPASSRQLWNDIQANGRLWSETPLGVRPARWRFPARNRIIAALADVVVVVESAAKGGSLHTVDSALERDRVVMAVPGPINSAASVGTNRLLIQGSEPVTGVHDIVAALGLSSRTISGNTPTMSLLAEPSSAADRMLIDAIGFDAASIDSILAATGLDPVVALSALGRLQADGLIRETGGWWERS